METAVIPDVIAERREAVRSFMDEHVYPNEAALIAEDERADALIAIAAPEHRDRLSHAADAAIAAARRSQTP